MTKGDFLADSLPSMVEKSLNTQFDVSKETALPHRCRDCEVLAAYYKTVVTSTVSFAPTMNPVIVRGQAYYVDGYGVYYQPCADDNTVYCVVPAPQNK